MSTRLRLKSASNISSTGIYRDLAELKRMIHASRYHMLKIDRDTYWESAMNHANKMVGYFVLSYRHSSPEFKYKYTESLVMEWEVLKLELRDIAELNIINYDPKRINEGHPSSDPIKSGELTREKIKFKLAELMISIERGLDKWFCSRSLKSDSIRFPDNVETLLSEG